MNKARVKNGETRRVIVLDTHIWIWLMCGDTRLLPAEVSIIESAAQVGDLFVPAISVWEVGMLSKKNRISLSLPCTQWVREALNRSGTQLVPLSPEIALESSFLPGDFHGDPADRIVVATARVLEGELITHDRKIIEYARGGHVNVLSGSDSA
jgi:PIN domain nuclease of toxin-antitoxin system